MSTGDEEEEDPLVPGALAAPPAPAAALEPPWAESVACAGGLGASAGRVCLVRAMRGERATRVRAELPGSVCRGEKELGAGMRSGAAHTGVTHMHWQSSAAVACSGEKFYVLLLSPPLVLRPTGLILTPCPPLLNTPVEPTYPAHT
jgi:hypothetical protein